MKGCRVEGVQSEYVRKLTPNTRPWLILIPVPYIALCLTLRSVRLCNTHAMPGSACHGPLSLNLYTPKERPSFNTLQTRQKPQEPRWSWKCRKHASPWQIYDPYYCSGRAKRLLQASNDTGGSGRLVGLQICGFVFILCGTSPVVWQECQWKLARSDPQSKLLIISRFGEVGDCGAVLL